MVMAFLNRKPHEEMTQCVHVLNLLIQELQTLNMGQE